MGLSNRITSNWTYEQRSPETVDLNTTNTTDMVTRVQTPLPIKQNYIYAVMMKQGIIPFFVQNAEGNVPNLSPRKHDHDLKQRVTLYIH